MPTIKSLITLFMFIVLFTVVSEAQKGTIEGTLKDSTTGEVLIDATVVVDGTSMGAYTDMDGKFEIAIEPGSYTLKISALGYTTKVIKNVAVKSGAVTTINETLGSDVEHVEVIVVGTKTTNTDAAVVEEVKNAVTVASGLSGEQINRGSDRDASEAVRRISGISVVDNRFVMVRGLSERYNAVMLNNALTPSFEQDVKAFSFDIIPSQMIDRVLVYKAPAPELPGEFAGGAIKIFTTGIPAKNTFNVGFSGSYRTTTTFKNFMAPMQGKYDWLSYNDHKNSLPQDVPPDFAQTDKYDNIKVGQLFRNDNWLPVNKKAPLDGRFNINFARRIELRGNKFIGIISAVNYSNTYQYLKGIRQLVLPYKEERLIVNNPDYNYKEDFYSANVRLGVLQNFALRLSKQHIFEFKNLYNHQGSSQYQFIQGNDQSVGGDYYKRYMLYNSYRGLYSGQITGTHSFTDNTEFDWAAGYSRATRDEPDVRRYMQTSPAEDENYRFNLVTGANAEFFGRIYGKTYEDVKMSSGNFKHTFAKWENFKPQFKAGWYLEERHRQYQLKVLGYQSNLSTPDNSGVYNNANISNWTLSDLNNPQSWNNYNGLVLTRGWNSGTSYTASNSLIAYYGGINLPYKDKLTIYSGVRVENNTQTVAKSTHLVSILPSVNATYVFNDKFQLRGAFGKTVNRPEFREIANLVFYDFYLFRTVQGNPNLKIPNIYNSEMRLEYYPRFGEVLSLGFFHKKFINPIERILIPVSGGSSFVSFQNAGQATSVGIEAEIRKSLDGILRIGGKDLFKHLTLSLNAALIRSRVHFDSVNILTVQERPMMGQSPYVVNAALAYTNDSINLVVNLTYNVIGKRIFIADNSGGNVYEMPRNVLDLTITKQIFRNLDLRFSIQDILNQRIQFVEDANNDGKVKRQKAYYIPHYGYKGGDIAFTNYNRGSYFTLGAILKF